MNSGLRRLTTTAAAILCTVGGALDAHAALVRFDFSGEIREFIVNGGQPQDAPEAFVANGVEENVAFSGYYILDTSLPPTSANDNGSLYLSSVVDFGLQVGGLDGDTANGASGSAIFGIQNNASLGDLWNIPLGSLDFGVPELNLLSFAVTLRDADGDALDSVDVNQPPPLLEDFDGFVGGSGVYTSLTLFFQVGAFSSVLVTGELIAHDATPIPVPPAIALFVGALAWLGRLSACTTR